MLEKTWHGIVEVASGEFILTKWGLPNGGSVILLRTIWVSVVLFVLAIGISELFDATKSWTPSWVVFQDRVHSSFHLYGAIFAAVYAALYTRFAQQWHYLAGVYNQIKAAQVRNPENIDSQSCSEWMAGYIEDAEILHLVAKPTVAAIIVAWGEIDLVREAYLKNSLGGDHQFNRILSVAQEAKRRHELRLLGYDLETVRHSRAQHSKEKSMDSSTSAQTGSGS